MKIKKEIRLNYIEKIIETFPFVGQANIEIIYDQRRKFFVINIFDNEEFLYKDNEKEKIQNNKVLLTSIFVTDDGYIHNIDYSLKLINNNTKNFCLGLCTLLDCRIIDLKREYENLKSIK